VSQGQPQLMRKVTRARLTSYARVVRNRDALFFILDYISYINTTHFIFVFVTFLEKYFLFSISFSIRSSLYQYRNRTKQQDVAPTQPGYNQHGFVLRATVVGMFSCHWIYLKNNMNISIFKQGKNIVNFKKVHLIPLQ
jgi:hypothetical protein